MSDTHTVFTQLTSPNNTVKALKCLLQLPMYVVHTCGGLQGNTYIHTVCSCAVQRVSAGEEVQVSETK